MSFKILDRQGSLISNLPADSVEKLDEATQDEEDTECGIGSFHPSWLQKFNTPKAFLINNATLGLLNGATFTYFIGCISTLEKRYAFDTKVAGIILLSEELCPFLLGFIISYLGSKSHRPRFIAFAMLITAMSSFVMATPYFIYGTIKDLSTLEQYSNRTNFELCGKPQSDICNNNPTLLAVSFFFTGLCMKGLGNVAFYTVGTPYLDDNIKKKNTALYLATSTTIQLLGPAFGFLLSSLCLHFYEDPFHDPGYGPEDPRWIGAWWIGFLIIGILMILFMLPVWLYPRHFPGFKIPKNKEKKTKESLSILNHLRDMKNIIIRLYKNPLLIFNQLGIIMRINGIEGYFILMPKYMEMQFKQSASKANFLSGPVLIIIMQAGIMLGGTGISKIRPRARVLTGGIVLTQIFTVVSFIFCMLITCPSFEMSDSTSTLSPKFNLENDCNRDCACSTKFYTPVCGPDGKTTYFSPCHAGCTDFNITDEKQIYTDCSCIQDEYGWLNKGDTTDGYCGFECQWMVAYVIIMGVGKFILATLGIANPIITLRCVDPKDKSIAMGAVTAMYSVLAFFPYPILYGALTDSSCLVWEKSCGKTGNCWIYDTDDFRYKLHGASIAFLAMGCFFDVCVWILSPRLKNLYGEEASAIESELKPVIKQSDGVQLAKTNNDDIESCNALVDEVKIDSL